MKKVFLFLLPALVLLVGCDLMPEEKPVITIDGESVVRLQSEAVDTVLSFTASDAWILQNEAEWLTLTPLRGEAGQQVISMKAEANTAKTARQAVVYIVCPGVEVEVTIEQLGTDGEEPTPLPDGKLVKQLVMYEDDNDMEEKTYFDFEYDAQGRVAVIMAFGAYVGKQKWNFTYNDGKIMMDADRFNFDTELFEKGLWCVADLDPQGRVIKLVCKELLDNDETDETNIILNYDEQGRLVKEIAVGQGYDDYAYTYIWNDNDLLNAEGGSGKWDFRYSEYENKANIDLNWLLTFGYVDGYLLPFGSIDALGARSKHYVYPDWGDEVLVPDWDIELERPCPADWTSTDEYSRTRSERDNSTPEYIFDEEGDLIKVTTAIPVYKTTYERKYWVTVNDYDNYEVIDGVRYYWDVEVHSEDKELSRERLDDDIETVEVSYY